MGPERLVKRRSKMAGWKAEDHELDWGTLAHTPHPQMAISLSLLAVNIEFFICQVTDNIASTSYCIVAIYYDHVILYIARYLHYNALYSLYFSTSWLIIATSVSISSFYQQWTAIISCIRIQYSSSAQLARIKVQQILQWTVETSHWILPHSLVLKVNTSSVQGVDKQ